MPQLVEVVALVNEIDRLDRRAGEPGVAQETPQLVFVSKAERVRAGRHLAGWDHAGRPSRIAEQGDHPRARRALPHRECGLAAGGEHSCESRGRLLGAGQVVEHERTDHGVELAGGEGQPLGVGTEEAHPRMAARGSREHPVRDVDAGRGRAPFRGRAREVPRSGGHVEHARAGTDPRRIEQRLDQPAGDLSGHPLVALGFRAPALGLERLERFRVHARETYALACPR